MQITQADWAAVKAGLRSGYETVAGLGLLAYGLAGTAHFPCPPNYHPCILEQMPTYNSSAQAFWLWFAHMGNWWPFAWAQIIIPSLRAYNTKRAINGGDSKPDETK